MNSLQISKVLSKISNHTLGVFPADKIIEHWQKPCCFVFNTDDSTKPGSHWVAMYVSRGGLGTYFDSYGLEPCIPNHIRLLRKNCRRFSWNTIQLQSNTSKVCGQYCLMFLSFMSKGKTLKQFLNKFSKNLEKNDKIVKKFVEKFYKAKFRRSEKYINGGYIQRCTHRYGWYR